MAHLAPGIGKMGHANLFYLFAFVKINVVFHFCMIRMVLYFAYMNCRAQEAFEI